MSVVGEFWRIVLQRTVREWFKGGVDCTGGK